MCEDKYKKNTAFLKEYGFSEDERIGGWINYYDLKIFQTEALTNMEKGDLNEKVYFKNITGKWIIYLKNEVLFLTNNDIEFMFGTNKMASWG